MANRARREGLDVTSDAPRLEVWTARHDNGWLAQAIENPDGTYAAWALPEGTTVSGPDYLEMDAETAKQAADFALSRKSGHRTCSAACSRWIRQTQVD